VQSECNIYDYENCRHNVTIGLHSRTETTTAKYPSVYTLLIPTAVSAISSSQVSWLGKRNVSIILKLIGRSRTVITFATVDME
jgi:hypothetical protein